MKRRYAILIVLAIAVVLALAGRGGTPSAHDIKLASCQRQADQIYMQTGIGLKGAERYAILEECMAP